MLAIRLARVGKKNIAQFKIVLQEHTVAPGGRHVEILGSYDPHLKKTAVNNERVKYWMEKGAQMSDTVHNLMISKGVISGEKRKVKIPAKVVEKAESAVPEVKAPEAKEEGSRLIGDLPASPNRGEPERQEKPKKEAKPEEIKKEVKEEEKKAEVNSVAKLDK